MQDLHLLRYSITNTVTEYQNSIHGCFPLLESNLGLWDGNRCFTDGLLKCLLARTTKGHSHKPSSLLSQSFTQIIRQGYSTEAFRNYIWFDVLCYSCYPFKYVSLHISSDTLLNTLLSLSQTSNISSKQSKKKSDLQTIHSNRLSSFRRGTHLRSAL